MKFEVTLTMTIEADSAMDAAEFGVEAGVHLMESFNDNGSIDPLMQVEASPVELAS